MTGEFLLMLAAFITVMNAGMACGVLLLGSIIAYSWFRGLTTEADRLPTLIQKRVNELAASLVPFNEEDLTPPKKDEPVFPLVDDPWTN